MNKGWILYVGNFDHPENNAAGKRVYGNALILQKIGYDILLLGKIREKSDMQKKEKTASGIRFISFPQYKIGKYKSYIKYVKKVIKQVGSPPQIVIRYGSPSVSIFDNLLFKYCKSHNIKLVVDVVDWLHSGSNKVLFSLVKNVDTFLEKAIFNKKADGIIAISSFLSSYYGQTVKTVITVPPIVEHYRKNETINRVVTIGYAGVPFRIGEEVKDTKKVKDRLDIAVWAMTMLIQKGHKMVFNIWGLTREEYLMSYPGHVELLDRVGSGIVFHGNRPMKEVQDQINTMDFTILLRDVSKATMAGFPTKVVESLALGTPVITTNTSDLRKYIIPANTGFFVDIDDENRLLEQLTYILGKDRNEITEMKNSCYRHMQFSADKYYDEMKHFIESL